MEVISDLGERNFGGVVGVEARLERIKESVEWRKVRKEEKTIPGSTWLLWTAETG